MLVANRRLERIQHPNRRIAFPSARASRRGKTLNPTLHSMPNQLAGESSPYLLQHQDNPVDWHPWAPQALERSRVEEKPIFLSIGYSACHWCHVMEHESFEDEEIAAFLNEHFISIKVDREERPDLDQIYMHAVTGLTGHGGWPMSVFLTPDLQPFHGGTYWPPRPSRGMPGFLQVLDAVNNVWNSERERAVQIASQLTEHLQNVGRVEPTAGVLRPELLGAAETSLRRSFDFAHGGFGGAPKFPHPMDLQALLRVWRRNESTGALEMVRLNLDKMAAGGIYDHLAGGFARYSVDERWLVPHFEKMLYDNALLAGCYLDATLATGDQRYGHVARETLDYILNYMTDAEGGFHSTEDADSEGVEGKFYVWTPAEIREVLGESLADKFCYVYDVSDQGNFEDSNILNLPKTVEQCAALRGWDVNELVQELGEARPKLLAVRDQRIRPGKDDKVLVSWNGLMIDSMARAAGILNDNRYLDAATRAADFIQRSMRRDDGRLLHSWRHGVARLDAYLDDYTCLANGLVTLYEAGFEERWIDEAVRLADTVLEHFRDDDEGGFFFTADDHEQLISRNKDLQDSSVPSGNSMAALMLLRLGRLCGRVDYVEAAEETLAMAVGLMERHPNATGQMLCALDMYLGPTPEIVILGDVSQPETADTLANLRRRFVPNKVVACRAGANTAEASPALEPIFHGKQVDGAGPTVFICQDFACQSPAVGKQEALAAWNDL